MPRKLSLVCSIFAVMSPVIAARTWQCRSSKERAPPPTAKELVGVWIGFDVMNLRSPILNFEKT